MADSGFSDGDSYEAVTKSESGPRLPTPACSTSNVNGSDPGSDMGVNMLSDGDDFDNCEVSFSAKHAHVSGACNQSGVASMGADGCVGPCNQRDDSSEEDISFSANVNGTCSQSGMMCKSTNGSDGAWSFLDDSSEDEDCDIDSDGGEDVDEEEKEDDDSDEEDDDDDEDDDEDEDEEEDAVEDDDDYDTVCALPDDILGGEFGIPVSPLLSPAMPGFPFPSPGCPSPKQKIAPGGKLLRTVSLQFDPVVRDLHRIATAEERPRMHIRDRLEQLKKERDARREAGYTSGSTWHSHCCEPRQEEPVDTPDSHRLVRRVRFLPDQQLVTVHRIVAWNFASRAVRVSEWSRLCRDGERFRRKISSVTKVLLPVLTDEHRRERYAAVCKSMQAMHAEQQ